MTDRLSYRASPRADDRRSSHSGNGHLPGKSGPRIPRSSAALQPRTERVSYTRELQLPVDAGEAFTLFLPGIFPPTLEPSGTEVPRQSPSSFPSAHAGPQRSVFRSKDEDGITNLWLPMGYDSAKRSIKYLRLTPGSRLGVVEVRCVPQPEGRTAAKVRYTFTQVTSDGSSPSKAFTEEHYDEMVGVWQRRIDEVLRQRIGRPEPCERPEPYEAEGE